MHLHGRRNFLAALGLGAGAYLLAPMHRQLVSEALGQASTRRRLFLYITGGGFAPGNKDAPGFWPKRGADETSFELGPALQPLAPYRSEMLFLESFHNPYDKHLHGNGFSTTTLQPDIGEGEAKQPSGISFDRWVAKEIGAGTPILSLNLCTLEVDDSDPQKTLTADGPRAAVPALLNPVKAFGQVFGNLAPGDDQADARLEARLSQDKSVLDAITGDITRMRDGLAGAERAKLDQYLTSVRELEVQMGALANARGSCAEPVPPPADIYKDGRRSPRAPVYRAMVDIAVNAMACGLTNVVTLFAAEGGIESLPLDNPDGDVRFCGSHQMWHGKGGLNDHVRYYSFQYGNMAEIRKRLGEFKEGTGSVADSTLLMNFCVTGGTHHNGQDEYFAVLIGKLGGKLRSGRYLSTPRGQRSMADVLLTAGQALGMKADRFGNAELKSATLPGVLA